MAKPEWKLKLEEALASFCSTLGDEEHLAKTPFRVVKMWEECLVGQPVELADTVLNTTFRANVSEMIYVGGIDFVTWCAHHLTPIICQGYFAYIPSDSMVGLSKIPRLVGYLANRPQVQERLTDQVVEAFQRKLRPLGCGFVVDGKHMCMVARGVKQSAAWVRTSSLRRCFLTSPDVKQEFLRSLPPIGGRV